MVWEFLNEISLNQTGTLSSYHEDLPFITIALYNLQQDMLWASKVLNCNLSAILPTLFQALLLITK